MSTSSTSPALKVKRLAPEVPLPKYQTAGAAGLDLCASLPFSHELPPQRSWMVPTGLSIELPSGHVGLVCPRSGLAAVHSVTVLNAPGVIDSDFRGEVKVLLVNHSHETFVVHPGDRIAQLVVVPCPQLTVEDVEQLSGTRRGSGGFGSTGQR